MNILALDLATKTGWALYENGRIESGVQDFSKQRGESNGMLFHKFNRWLQDFFANQFAIENREELAWAAGFFDGEGSTLCMKAYEREHQRKDGSSAMYSSDNLVLQITQAGSPALLERFQKAIGGGGWVNGPYEDKRPQFEETPQLRWQFRIGGLEACRDAILKLWPWLGSVKRAQAEEALISKLCNQKRIPAPSSDRGLIVYEMPHHRGGYATEIAVGLATRVQEFAAKCGIEHAPVHSMTLKKWATGSGKADKAAMVKIATTRKWGFNGVPVGTPPMDDNEADAFLLLGYALEKYGEGTACNARPATAAAVKSMEQSNLEP